MIWKDDLIKKKEKIQKKISSKSDKIKDEEFEIVLVDINETIENNKIICVKKNLYEIINNYYIISYRWGELDEQFVSTPYYDAYVTSFDINDFIELCKFGINIYFKNNINYVWVDAICVNQRNYEERKKTIYRMSDIYSYSNKVICVPDLHISYLKNNPMNYYIYNKIREYKKEIICIIENGNSLVSLIFDINRLYFKNHISNDIKLSIEKNYDDIKLCFKWLSYIIDEWINRTWVISEVSIGRNNNNIIIFFMSLEDFFNIKDITKLSSSLGSIFEIKVNIEFESLSFFQSIIDSKASKHEDRFYAILPHYNYKYDIEDIKNWKLDNINDVKNKLFKIIGINNKRELLKKLFLLENKLYENRLYENNDLLRYKPEIYINKEKDMSQLIELYNKEIEILERHCITKEISIVEFYCICHSFIAIGNKDENKWILIDIYKYDYHNFDNDNERIFNIYF
jgi:hypothetical protein